MHSFHSTVVFDALYVCKAITTFDSTIVYRFTDSTAKVGEGLFLYTGFEPGVRFYTAVFVRNIYLTSRAPSIKTP